MTIYVTVKLYGRYRDTAHSETITLHLEKGKSIKDVIEAFIEQYPEFSKDTRGMMVSKNGVLTGHDTPFTTADQIAIAPPVVSGG